MLKMAVYNAEVLPFHNGRTAKYVCLSWKLSAWHALYFGRCGARKLQLRKIQQDIQCVRLSVFLICSKCGYIHVFDTFEGGYNCLYSVYFIIVIISTQIYYEDILDLTKQRFSFTKLSIGRAR